MKANEKEFEENLKRLGDLYERGKDLCNSLLPAPATSSQISHWDELRTVLREMRDLAAVQMRHIVLNVFHKAATVMNAVLVLHIFNNPEDAAAF